MAVLVGGVGVAALCMAVPVAAHAQAQSQRSFDIPSQPANRAILEFARQAGVQIVASGRILRNLRTHPVRGRYEIRDALEAMFEGTGIRILAYSGDTITLGLASRRSGRTAQGGTSAAAGGDGRAGTGIAQRPLSRRGPAGSAELTRLADPLPHNPEIIVTGSRIRTNGYDAPVPVTVIDSARVESLAQTSAQEIVRLIPQNIATQSDATAGNGYSDDIGAAYANLRGLNPTFGTRTLVLVNSRRFVPTSEGGQLDLNLIPTVMIGRIETVTGGASAAYGSDAVAGVVNILLDDRLRGFKGQLDYGQTSRSDGGSLHAAAAYGFDFAGGRGSIVAGVEYQRNRGISHCSDERRWCAESWGIFVNAAGIEPGTRNVDGNVSGFDVPGSFGYGQPNYIVGPNSGMIYNSPYGAIRNFTRSARTSTTTYSNIFPAIDPPLAAVDKVFTPDGRGVIDYDPGLYGPKNVGGQSMGGDNLSAYSDQAIQTPLERYTAYAAGKFDLSSALSLSAELTAARRVAEAPSPISASRSTMAIRPDNAFLPASVAALLGGSAFSLGKDVDGELENTHRVTARVFRGVLGLSGGLFGDWRWDGYYQYGDNRRTSVTRYARHNDSFVMAIDAVRDPTDPSRIICRPLDPVVLANFATEYQTELRELHARCVPLNLFGIGNMDPAAIDFVWHRLTDHFDYRQHVVAANAEGTLFRGLGAGPARGAAGLEYRDERGVVSYGGLNPNAYAGTVGLAYAGSIRVVEAFAETSVPVLRDSPAGDLLELNGAVRYTNNRSDDLITGRSRSVDAVSWKLGAIYDVTGGVRLRATRSRDIRAAGFRELFQKTAPTDEGTVQGRVDNPNIAGPDKVDNTPIFSGGNFGLTPEKADTSTVGAVLTPGFAPGFRLSLDWYRIKVTDAIANLNGQRVTDLCVVYRILCDRIAFATPTNITRIDAGQANVGRIEIRGFDFEASYRFALSDVAEALRGNLDLRFLLNHQYDFLVKQDPAVPTIDYAGQSGPAVEGGDFYPAPKWMWNVVGAYDRGPFTLTAMVRHVGKGMLNAEWTGPEDAGYDPALPNSVNLNRVPARTYVNLALTYEIAVSEGRRIELFGLIENLFDTKPPVAPGGTTTVLVSAYPTNPVLFDTFGMRWRAGARIRF